MNLLKSMPLIPARQYNPETIDYRDRIVAAGSSISTASLDAVEKFVRDCKNALIWDKLTEVGPFCGSSLAGALVKLKHAGQGSLTNVNFVSGDYQERGPSGGLLGDGATKYLGTGFNAQSLPDNGHMSFYLREDIAAGGNRIFIGASVTTDQYWLGTQIPASEVRSRYGAALSAVLAEPASKGFYLSSRTAANALSLYRNGVSVAAHAGAVVHAKPNAEILVFGFTSNGAAASLLGARGSYYSIGAGLSADEAAALHRAVQTLQLNLNRNV